MKNNTEKNRKMLLNILRDIKPGFEFEGKIDLVESGEIDSFDVITFVSELNEVFSIDVPVEEIVPENFNSLEAMLALVEKLL